MEQTAASMITQMRPALRDLDQLTEPLTEAESQVARALSRLDGGWTVYVQPRLGLDQPDFLATHDRYGICAIEVKGWLPHAVRQSETGGFEFSTDSGGWTPSVEQPRFKASRYRTTLYDQFFALPEDGGTPPPEIRAMVILPYFTTEQATHLFDRAGVVDDEQVVGVWGGDVLGDFDDVVRGMGCQPPNPASMRRLREHVVVSERITLPVEQHATLSAGSIELATNPSGLRARRACGAAGSGKTFGLTARAARLAADGKNVLLLSYNVTLANHLRSLATQRCREVGANPTLITCANFHTFCTRVVQDAEVDGHHLEAPAGAPWTVAIVAKVEQAFEQGFTRTYDAILIDEGQDFNGDWWKLLRTRVLAPDGEMLVVADPTQDVYNRYEWTTDESVGGTGFSGPWTELAGSYRSPDDVTAFANEFATANLDGEVISMTHAPDHTDVVGSVTANGSVRHWTNVERVNDLGRAVGLEVVRILQDNPSLSPGDVTFLCDYHHDGVAAVRVIEAAGIPVHHIFSRDPDAPRRRRKHRFWPEADAVTGCTMHSYKGWGTPALALGIGADARARRIAYVSMTRVAALDDGRPSVVSVLNADKNLADLQTAFEEGSAAPAPKPRPAPPTPIAVAPPATPEPFSAPEIHVPPPPPMATQDSTEPAAAGAPATQLPMPTESIVPPPPSTPLPVSTPIAPMGADDLVAGATPPTASAVPIPPPAPSQAPSQVPSPTLLSAPPVPGQPLAAPVPSAPLPLPPSAPMPPTPTGSAIPPPPPPVASPAS